MASPTAYRSPMPTGGRGYGSPQAMAGMSAGWGQQAQAYPQAYAQQGAYPQSQQQAAYAQQAQYGQQQQPPSQMQASARQQPQQQYQQQSGYPDRAQRQQQQQQPLTPQSPQSRSAREAPVQRGTPAGWQPVSTARQRLSKFDGLLDESIFNTPLPAFLMRSESKSPNGGAAFQQGRSQGVARATTPQRRSVDGHHGAQQQWNRRPQPTDLSTWGMLCSTLDACGAICHEENEEYIGTPRQREAELDHVPVSSPGIGATSAADKRSSWIRTAPPMEVGAQQGGEESALVAQEDATDNFFGAQVRDMRDPRQEHPGSPNYMPLRQQNQPAVPRQRRMGERDMHEALSLNRCSMSSLKGNKASSTNQDRTACLSLNGGAGQMFVVLDGHGEGGEKVSDVLIELLPKMVLRALASAARSQFSRGAAPGPRNPQDGTDGTPDIREIISEAVSQSFFEAHHLMECLTTLTMVAADPSCISPRDMSESRGQRSGGGYGPPPPTSFSVDTTAQWNRLKIDARQSGTTATMVLLLPPQRALIAHVGDSRAVAGVRPRSEMGSRWRTLELTRDHKPDLPDERARIEQTGAQVTIQTIGPLSGERVVRVYTENQAWPTINMTRSIGDLHAHTQGLCATAEVRLIEQLWDTDREDAVLILATDGVWDVIDSSEAVEIVTQQEWSSSVDPSAVLTKEAHRRWRKRNLQGNYADDITAVVKFL
eukprot:gnl/TRDRNA2_/TRDRNA2_36739_c0_seq1.p1 gnl/TRDRNA2_/TRDRNA2_36739_c0~~gnl/TRDRNA2_/TRDRNA2_36739_c0_seq1.p1  ORF type:complete len:710 (-),score=123.93 gnl/TRDRNA2_/TRDRNA2_36739_c0_seq1:160-2289(-)